jgi:hypothetical protein
MEVAHTEAVEAELTRFIERRSRNGEHDPDEQEESWRQSVARFHECSEAEMRHRWIEYEQHMSELHGRLSREHEEKAQKLLEESDDRKESA